MSSELSALLSATFHSEGCQHLIELVHQRDEAAKRRLASLQVSVFDAAGNLRLTESVDPLQEILDLSSLLGKDLRSPVMVVFDARYDARVFPYRPHHYGYLRRAGSPLPPLYYAVNAVLGGVPDRIGATGINNFETYLFLRRPRPECHSVLLGNVSRFSEAKASVLTYYGETCLTETVVLVPKAHVELPLVPQHDGALLERVEVKAVFRLASYVVGRDAASKALVLYDHMFTYFR
jgi:hypothetical protein